MWFKATNPGQGFKAAVSAALARLAPAHVLPPLSVDADRGWLLLPDGGQSMRDQGEVSADWWEKLVVQAAGLQQALVPHETELLAAGLPVLGPSDVEAWLAELVDELRQLRREDPQHISAASARELLAAGDARESDLSQLSMAGVPLTLQPNDINPGNALVFPGSRRLALMDFGDAFWSHPFAALQVPTRLAAGSWPHRPAPGHPLVRRLHAAYANAWGMTEPDAARLIVIADRLASIHRCQSWRRLMRHVDQDRLDAPPPLLHEWLTDALLPTR